MAQPEISIITPVYNVEKYIERCVNSLTNQTFQNIEIILVDDSSTDSSLEICKKLAENDPRIKVLHKENEGAGMARNAALKVATGKYIGFVDSDDYVDPDMFQTLYEKAEKYGSDLILSGYHLVDGSIFSKSGSRTTKVYFDKDTQIDNEEDIKKLKMGIVGSLPEDKDDSKYGMSLWKNLFRHEVIQKNNITFESEREKFSEDALFMVDYIASIKKATGINEAFYNYCRNGNSISKSYDPYKFRNSLAFIKEVETRFKKDIEPEKYEIYMYRFWQAICRVICSQEIMHATDQKIEYKVLRERLKMICTHEITVKTFKNYPLHKLPLAQRIFAYGIKHKMYYLLKVLVGLRR